MRIVHLLPALEEGGVESVVLNLSRLLVRAGHEVIVLSRGGRLVASLEKCGAQHIAFDLKSKNPLTYLPRVLRLKAILKEVKPDVVAAHSRVPAWLFVGANRTLRLPWITYAHGANSVSCYSSVMTRGDRIVVPSKYLGDYLVRNYGEGIRPRLHVIANIVDLERFDPEKVDQAYCDEKHRAWGIGTGEKVTMSIGRLTPIKGFENVLADFAEKKEGKLVIVGAADRGKTAYLGTLKALAATLGIADRVIFAGHETRMPEILALADEVVVGNTKKPETFGLSVAEAYAMNRPVRALKSFGGVKEVMDDVRALHLPTTREAVAKLYGFGIISNLTLKLYEEMVK